MAKLFSDAAAEQYEQIARKVLADKPGDLGRAFDLSRAGQNAQFVRVTGAATTSAGVDYYPGRVTLKNKSTGAWADITPAADVWLEERNGVVLVTDGTAVYHAKQLTDSFDVSGTKHALFVTVGASDCTTSTGSFPTVDETNADPAFKFLGTDPVLGTRNLKLSDLLKAAQKAMGIFAITSSSTPTLNLHNGLYQKMQMTSSPTFSISNDWDSARFTLELSQDGTGGRVPTFWSGVKWGGQIQPRPTLTANATDIYTFRRLSSGSYFGMAALNFQ